MNDFKKDREEQLDKVREIIKLIECNDSKILNQMAEIILAAKEKIKED